jgi:hypothetical protein
MQELFFFFFMAYLNCERGGQDVWSGKEWRKLSVVWKLLVLVVIGGTGIYVCMVGVGTRQISYEPLEELIVKDWRREDDSCTGHGSAVDFYQHYPLPHTYERYGNFMDMVLLLWTLREFPFYIFLFWSAGTSARAHLYTIL